jgi:hypothetical protein
MDKPCIIQDEIISDGYSQPLVWRERSFLNRSHLKIRIFGRDQGETEDQSAGILKYVEDLSRELNADIGQKDFFEIAYRVFALQNPAIGME